MKIPKAISKNNHEYILVKEYPNFILYKDLITGVKECFTPYQLGLIKEQEAARNIRPENVTFLQEVQMNREDLKNYKYNQIWIKDQTEYIETQKENINRLNSILSDMPRGSKQVYDSEAEKLAKLMDQFNNLMDYVIEEKEKQKKIVEIVNRIEFPYKNILFKYYIQGKKLVTVASEMHYNYEYTKKISQIALIKFDEECKK